MTHSTPSKEGFTTKKKISLLVIFVVTLLSIGSFFYLLANKSYSLSKALTEEKICLNTSEDNFSNYSPCMTSLIIKIAEEKSIPVAVDMMNSIALKTEGMRNYCHTIAHDVAKKLYLDYKDKAYVGDYAACSQGYAHGLMQGAAESKDLMTLAHAVFVICSNSTAGDKGGCVHGAGHSVYDAKLDISQLLKVCEIVVPKLYSKVDNDLYIRSQKNCVEGWAMQLAVMDRAYFKKFHSLSEVLLPCDISTGYYKFGCITSFARQYVVNTSESIPESLVRVQEYKNYCSTNYAPGVDLILCNNSLGAAVADVFTKRVSVEDEAKGLVLGCGSELERDCLRGFANNILSRNSNDLVFAKKLCDLTPTLNSREVCFKGFEEEAKTYNM